jgi:hypothetical protein
VYIEEDDELFAEIAIVEEEEDKQEIVMNRR